MCGWLMSWGNGITCRVGMPHGVHGTAGIACAWFAWLGEHALCIRRGHLLMHLPHLHAHADQGGPRADNTSGLRYVHAHSRVSVYVSMSC